jgi:tRNA modification GTPase
VQAEAVRDLVDAVTPLQARAAFDQLEGTLTTRIRDVDAALLELVARLEASLDFPDEGYHFVDPGGAAADLRGLAARIDGLLADADRGRLLREGAQVAIVGRPNAGKSSLFNRLAGAGRAIVTDIPGTTRDLVTETVDIDGVPMTLVDTAGIRDVPGDAVEAEGIARSRGAQAVASVVVVVLDGSAALTAEDHHVLQATRDRRRVIVASKSDLPGAWRRETADAAVLDVSARTGDGIDALRRAIADALAGETAPRELPAVTNARHAALLRRARAALGRAAAAAGDGTPEEFVLIDVNDARAALEEVTGVRTAEDVLEVIFRSFCIGK